jgi:hypothetical protein
MHNNTSPTLNKLPPWANAAQWFGDHLAVPALVVIVGAFVYVLGSIFNLSMAYAALTCAAVAGSVVVHGAWIATARTHTERLYNAVAFGLWMVALLMFGVAAMAISRQNISNADGRGALMGAGLSLEMIALGEQLYAMAAPLAVASVALAWLMRQSQAISGGDGFKAAVVALCAPVAKIAAVATSFLHIQHYSIKIGYDQFSAVTGALVADVWFLAASFGAVYWLKKRDTLSGRRTVFMMALLGAFTAAPWSLMLIANASAAMQITGRNDVLTIIAGCIPVIAAGAFALIELAGAAIEAKDREAARALEHFRIMADTDAARQHELAKIRTRAEIRSAQTAHLNKDAVALAAVGAPASTMTARVSTDTATASTHGDLFPASNGYLRHSRKGTAGNTPTTHSARTCAQCGAEFVGSGRRAVCSDECGRARNAGRMRAKRAQA